MDFLETWNRQMNSTEQIFGEIPSEISKRIPKANLQENPEEIPS